jgi:hypothetical protein
MTLSYKIAHRMLVGEYVQSHQISLIALLITILVGYTLFRSLTSQLVPEIQIPLPLQARPGWTSKVISNPSIQSKDPSLIQCYCPATGQLIDTIKAATTDDVDEAIEKSKAAQLKWQNTTFSERALVLKTLLKFILENQGIETACVLLTQIRAHSSSLLSRFRGNLIEYECANAGENHD